MAKAKRKQKLKVYCTPVGFHNALVAAPSQKAALEAWGVATNLFARGAAEIVTDPELTKVPLENPGQVVKVIRGTRAEQLAALAKQEPPKRSSRPKAEVLPKKPKRKIRPPKPSRSALGKAEESLQKLEKRQAAQREALEQRIGDLRRRHEQERDRAQERVEREQSKYESALERYESG